MGIKGSAAGWVPAAQPAGRCPRMGRSHSPHGAGSSQLDRGDPRRKRPPRGTITQPSLLWTCTDFTVTSFLRNTHVNTCKYKNPVAQRFKPQLEFWGESLKNLVRTAFFQGPSNAVFKCTSNQPHLLNLCSLDK